jgi:peptidylprolyl isomerase
MRLTRLNGLALAGACVGLAACGGTKTADIPSGGGSTSTTTATATAPTTTATTAKPALGKPTAAIKALAKAAGADTTKKPKIGKPTGKPPTQLTIVDIVQGTGPPAQTGSPITVDYAGNSWSTGKEFDASWKRKQTFPLTLGASQVIPGWDQGLVGMKKGGRRMLVIPPDMAYGANGRPPTIAPNETLIFVVDLRKIG